MTKLYRYRAPALNKDRPYIYAEYDLDHDHRGVRVRGNMRSNDVCDVIAGDDYWRSNFNVQLKDGRFKVDIGTGSGVNITFAHVAAD